MRRTLVLTLAAILLVVGWAAAQHTPTVWVVLAAQGDHVRVVAVTPRRAVAEAIAETPAATDNGDTWMTITAAPWLGGAR